MEYDKSLAMCYGMAAAWCLMLKSQLPRIRRASRHSG